MVGHQPLELLAGVLAAAIRVMEQRPGLSPPPDAITRASVTIWAVIVVLMDQLTKRRENRSTTAAT